MRDELQALIDSLAERLGRSVTIDDPELRLIVYTSHRGIVDKVRLDSILHLQPAEEVVRHIRSLRLGGEREDVIRLPAVPEMEMLARACAPLRAGGEHLGQLIVIDAEDNLSDAERQMIADTARSAALVMHREKLLNDIAAERVRALLRDLIEEDDRVRDVAGRALAAMNDDIRPPFRVSVLELRRDELDPDSVEEQTAVVDHLVRRATRHAPGTVHLTRSDHVLILHPKASDQYDLTLQTLSQIRTEVIRGLGVDGDLHTGVGDRVSTLQRVRHSYLQSRRALYVAVAVPGFGPYVEWSGIGVYRALAELASAGLASGVVPEGIHELMQTEAGIELLRTVEIWLDQATDVRRTVELLHVHRTSVYYRLNRFTELTGLDLQNGGERLAVHLGLKLARLEGSYQAPLPRGSVPRPAARVQP
ncbi:CdaR family transcriptional regulator [Nocardioides sp. L-11A]|uniref:PucR family transcriptional regulator n=1 Tax=Nocardioides sp. L-11A TaxID=3043848 RepID=UPI00249A3423|nr:helix-turn-helix domain-containing protein [Nocardioides sp. L-11A]